LAQGLTVGTLLKRLGLSGGRPAGADYARLSGERLACQAALRELDRLRGLGFVSRAVADGLEQEYQGNLERLETEVDALHLSDEALAVNQRAEARRLMLLAEKSALLEANRSGMLDEEDWRALSERIDTQLEER